MSSYTSYSQWRTPSATSDHHSSNNNTVLDQGPRAKCDQVIYEALAKACEVIVHSRSSAVNQTAVPSSRFNLHVPEHAHVRGILSNYRQSLHVPVRLDVYYQHPPDASGGPGRRELLERWCLEYSQVTTERFLESEGGLVSKDPIVQLRHVCKRIVIWLRTLHCWCRLLPAQALKIAENHIGFSIYVNSAGQDDVTSLQDQGFGWQTPPATVVTPFGELAWKVLYAPPRPVLERLVALHQKQRLPISAPTTAARPIPIKQQSEASEGSGFLVAQSAPAHLVRNERGARSVGHNQGAQHTSNGQTAAGYHPQNTFDPSRLHQRSQSTLPPSSPGHGHSGGVTALRRRNTSIGTPEHSANPAPIHEMPAKDGKPARVMSGLSLAMLMVEDEQDGESNSVSEKRRAALHQMPPHLTASTANAAAAPASSEYGYAYNSHIPWQKIHPSSTNPSAVGRSLENNTTPTDQQPMSFSRPGGLSSSPAAMTPSSFALASTPPSGAFGLMLGLSNHNLPPGMASGPLLPPRQTPITPPFGARPIGLQAPPPMSLASTTDQQGGAASSAAAPTPALDLLHSSPFHQQGSVLGSTMMLRSTGPPSTFDNASSALSASYMMQPQGSLDTYGDMRDPEDQDEEDDMPFAVDGMDGFASNQPTLSSSTAAGGSSMAVASLAQQCISSNKLRLFESLQAEASQMPNDTTDDMNSLMEQLSEFKSFGASLQLSTTSSEA